jgi:hypothetical protein
VRFRRNSDVTLRTTVTGLAAISCNIFDPNIGVVIIHERIKGIFGFSGFVASLGGRHVAGVQILEGTPKRYPDHHRWLLLCSIDRLRRLDRQALLHILW